MGSFQNLCDGQTKAFGTDARFWQFCGVSAGAKPGGSCNIGTHVFVENDAMVCNKAKTKFGVQSWDGLRFVSDVEVSDE